MEMKRVVPVWLVILTGKRSQTERWKWLRRKLILVKLRKILWFVFVQNDGKPESKAHYDFSMVFVAISCQKWYFRSNQPLHLMGLFYFDLAQKSWTWPFLLESGISVSIHPLGVDLSKNKTAKPALACRLPPEENHILPCDTAEWQHPLFP